jgi:hypothetical protein
LSNLIGKNDRPKHVDIEYEIYAEEDVRKTLAACETLKERALVQRLPSGESPHQMRSPVADAVKIFGKNFRPGLPSRRRDGERFVTPRRLTTATQ